jgi:hypothetical protein
MSLIKFDWIDDDLSKCYLVLVSATECSIRSKYYCSSMTWWHSHGCSCRNYYYYYYYICRLHLVSAERAENGLPSILDRMMDTMLTASGTSTTYGTAAAKEVILRIDILLVGYGFIVVLVGKHASVFKLALTVLPLSGSQWTYGTIVVLLIKQVGTQSVLNYK